MTTETDSFTANSASSLERGDPLDPLCQPEHPPLQIRYSYPNSRTHSRQGSTASHSRNASVTGLHIRTDIPHSSSSPAVPATTTTTTTTTTTSEHQRPPSDSLSPSSNSDSASTIVTAHSLAASTDLRRAISAASLNSALSPNGALGSPMLSAMIDITPLPSPITAGELSPGPWKRVRSADGRNNGERPSSSRSSDNGESSHHRPPRFNVPTSPGSPPKKQKGYGSLMSAALGSAQTNAEAYEQNQQSHIRNRSISEFVPEHLHNARPRNVTLALGSNASSTSTSREHAMHREHYLAAHRGLVKPTPSRLAHATKALPSPPPSNKSVTSGSELDEEESRSIFQEQEKEDANVEYFHVRDAHNPSKKRRWRAVRPLGQGTFSKVILATSERLPPMQPYVECNLDPRKLVAVKIVEHGPAGGADEERIEVSLKREVDILKSVSHPSIVQLQALEYTDERALLVLSYCPGGDLFDMASQRRELLTSRLVQRIFAEMLAAVRYLHDMDVVHRDLKLEKFLQSLHDPRPHPHPLVCITDLGLSRRIPPPPASPVLTTRCGSEDYAAPEILLGQPYDGRSTDAWALGVLLYALMEGRLPFDCPPGKIERSRVSHRVARCDWIWGRFGDEDGEWDASKDGNAEWRGAGEVVEALLKKVRMGRKSLKEIESWKWVKEGIRVPALKRVDDGGGDL
ncbi:kinase-like domain-containing protein [Delphinella strobiligena]|nr:kinase-like domain-containing protein [Delphinella strobiligena]